MIKRFSILSLFILGVFFSIPMNGQSSAIPAEGVLLVINAQVHFTKDVVQEGDPAAVIREINSLIGQFDETNVIYINSLLRVLSLSSGGSEVDTVPGMEQDPDLILVGRHILEKTKPDAFSLSELSDILGSHPGVPLMITGFFAGHSVYRTALTAIKSGYEVFIHPGAVAARTAKEKNEILKKLKKKGVHILP